MNRLECIYCLTQTSGGDIYMCIYIYIYIIYYIENQLYVSELDNGHLQVVYETLRKQLYRTCIWATYMG